MKIPRPDLAALVLVGLCIAAITFLAATHVGIPDVLTYVAVGALGVGGGTALNGAGAAVSAVLPETSSSSAPALPPVPAPRAPADPAATGTFARIATHAP